MSAAFSADGAHVITAGADRTARIWDTTAPDDNVVATFQPNSLRYASMQSSRPADSHSPYGWLRLGMWPIDGKGDTREFRGNQYPVNTVAFSRDGQRVVTAGSRYNRTNLACGR